jgi:hypothetical protein
MREKSFSAERDHLEPDPLAALADFFRVKTAGWRRQFVNDPLDERCFPAFGSAREQNLLWHITTSTP